jgi:multimeric flavodoxin WrbA
MSEDKGNLEVLAEKIEDFVKEQGYEVENINTVMADDISIEYMGTGRYMTGEINLKVVWKNGLMSREYGNISEDS